MPLEPLRIKPRLRHRMWVQMAVPLALLAALPLMLLGWLLINASQTAVKTSVLRDQRQLVSRAASELAEFVRRPQELLRSTAAILGTLQADAWKHETALVELSLNDETFGRIASIDGHGKEIATSDLGTALIDRSSEPGVRQALRGEPFISEIAFSQDHAPFMSMAVPVRSQGRIVGALAAEVRLRGFWDIVDAIRLGETGRAFVISQKGVLVAGEDKKKVLANEDWSGEAVVRAALEGRTGSLEEGEWLKAYAPIAGVGWALVLRQSTAEAYSFLELMKLEAWALILISLGLALATGIFLARLLVSPTQLLAKKMGLLAQGDLDQRIGSSRRDEMGALMNAFDQMAERLKLARESEKLAVIGKAAAAITHELKNSLILVSTFIGLLPEKKDDKQFLLKFSTVVPEELRGWKEMLDSISDYSRRSRFELAVMDLDDFLSDFVFLIRQRLADQDVALSVDVPEGLPRIRGNPQKLKQAFLNLTLNALEAMPKGGVLSLTAARHDGFVRVSFTDNGAGIAPERLARIFEPFYSTKTNGLGLGLSVSHEILSLHGGRLTAEGRPGEGASFHAEIPVLP